MCELYYYNFLKIFSMGLVVDSDVSISIRKLSIRFSFFLLDSVNIVLI